MKLDLKKSKFIPYILSLLSIFLIWEITACRINASLILPYPKDVLLALAGLFQKKYFWNCFFLTFLRSISAFLISVLLGSIIGILMSASAFTKSFFELPVSIVRTTPVISIILLALFWFKSDTLPILVSVIMTMPIMISSVISGYASTSGDLLKMAKVYELSDWEVLKNIRFPAIISYFLNGLTDCFGLTWKVIVAGEVLSLPGRGLGTILQKAQVHLESAETFAITIFLILISFALEKLLSLCIRCINKKRGVLCC